MVLQDLPVLVYRGFTSLSNYHPLFYFSEGGTGYVAGGEHKGIVINKDGNAGAEDLTPFPHLSLEFRVFLVNTNTGKHAQVSKG